MHVYKRLLQSIKEEGEVTENRTGVETKSIFGAQYSVSLQDYNYPLITLRKIHFKSVVEELLWFLRGETNVKSLNEKGVTIWDPWADKDGELGPIYGKQWRYWELNRLPDPHAPWEHKDQHGSYYVDQIERAMYLLKNEPDSRRIIVSPWNPADIDEMKIPPCHTIFQFRVVKDKLNCMLFQRSCDVFHGLPFNLASYSLLTIILAKIIGYEPGKFVHSIADAHYYLEHEDAVNEMLLKEPKRMPKLKVKEFFEKPEMYSFEDFELLDYVAHESINRKPIL